MRAFAQGGALAKGGEGAPCQAYHGDGGPWQRYFNHGRLQAPRAPRRGGARGCPGFVFREGSHAWGSWQGRAAAEQVGLALHEGWISRAPRSQERCFRRRHPVDRSRGGSSRGSAARIALRQMSLERSNGDFALLAEPLVLEVPREGEVRALALGGRQLLCASARSAIFCRTCLFGFGGPSAEPCGLNVAASRSSCPSWRARWKGLQHSTFYSRVEAASGCVEGPPSVHERPWIVSCWRSGR